MMRDEKRIAEIVEDIDNNFTAYGVKMFIDSACGQVFLLPGALVSVLSRETGQESMQFMPFMDELRPIGDHTVRHLNLPDADYDDEGDLLD